MSNAGNPRHAEALYQRLEEDMFFAGLDLDVETVEAARRAAKLHGATLEAELICGGAIDERRFYEAVAAYLGLPLLQVLPIDRLADAPNLDLMLKLPHSIRLQDSRSPATTVIVPQLQRLAHLRTWLRESPELALRIACTTPSAMREAVWRRGEARRLRDSVSGLAETMPRFSARLTLTAMQGFSVGVAVTVTAVALTLSFEIAYALIHLVLSLLYLATVLFRLSAHLHRRVPDAAVPTSEQAGPLPVYSVLVALYREADMVPQLISALRRLDWPASRLDIKLICEAGDAETLHALALLDLPPYMEIVVVPDMAPRTKPKALTYALAGARGSLLTIYDAEDRPHPGQLKAAHARFCENGPDLACVQAPLSITNAGESWLSSLFAAEYAIHFRHLLPLLAAHRLPVPLGGTSNHFRREALDRAGGWDPYNVTEDADLGLRLYRLGYRVDTIAPPTLEDAPANRRVWIGQRSRWFKGWLQTFLVSMRRPRALARDLGFTGMLAYLLTIFGMLVSALCHPLLFASLGWLGLHLLSETSEPLSVLDTAFLTIDLVNLFASYAYFAVAGLALPPRQAEKRKWRHVVLIPAYWLLLSFAAWRALVDLYRNPHFWEKTPHRPVEMQRGQRGGTGLTGKVSRKIWHDHFTFLVEAEAGRFERICRIGNWCCTLDVKPAMQRHIGQGAPLISIILASGSRR